MRKAALSLVELLVCRSAYLYDIFSCEIDNFLPLASDVGWYGSFSVGNPAVRARISLTRIMVLINFKISICMFIQHWF